ncbi:lytic transglycosylase domain-containing protein [Stenotrophomonas maltophilia]|uniref:transglycosylase SLT domain-containing protein n=1 Tax=Stenotrophomonas maltophilia TaxID=40324 RepID=UPI0015E01324|nr:transglycosylase SLT domain-containing protein [Stenotrophomonas maltophilia]MBA0421319.1 lytic transglycosylase domain-containing protein [Stenotrophomonas maltophilia]
MTRHGRPDPGLRLAIAVCLVLVALATWAICGKAEAAPARATVKVAPASALYRHRVEQAASRAWGVNASSARLAAQLHQESAFRADARSPVGAQGIAQFMPSTARWIATIYPTDLAGFDPWNPQQAILAAALYDRWLFDRVAEYSQGRMSSCSRWAFTFRAYNGGEKALNRERALAYTKGADANDWRAVEPYRARAEWAHRENTGYPKRILLTLEPAYLAAGWTGVATCP